MSSPSATVHGMADTPPPLPEVGPWAREKLGRLGKYLSAYTTIMRRQAWCRGYYYVDAFAGAGDAKLRTKESQPLLFDAGAQEVIRGSPRVALEIEHPFTRYDFVELSADRRAHLNALRAEFAGRRCVEVVDQDCNAYLCEFVRSVDWSTHRGVVFLDPFGMSVPWSTVAAIAATKALEVFINFPVGMAIQRFLKKDGVFTAEERAFFDAYLGDPSWFDAVYTTTTSQDMFGDVIDEVRKTEESGDRLAAWYCERLADAFSFSSRPYLVRNTKKGHLYYLIFAGPNETGAKIANEVLQGGEVVGSRKRRSK